MGAGVTVAVLDSGVAYEDCSAAICGADYSRAPDFEGTTFVSPWDFVADDAHPNDENGHGTHVASTVAEATNNGVGAAGIAPGASIMPVRVLDADGNGDLADEIDGIVWATDNGADVINLSLGQLIPTLAEQDAMDYALDRGVVVIAAAGNRGLSLIDCPACYPGVIAVGATRIDQTRSFYSSYGDGIGGHTLDLVAPGGDTSVDQNGDGYVDGVLQQTFNHKCDPFAPVDFSAFVYCFLQGTSMASPHVAGMAALVLSINPDLTVSEVRDILTSTATDLGPAGYDLEYGHGLLNAAEAVAAAQDTLPAALTPTPTPTGPTLTPTPTPTGPTPTPTATIPIGEAPPPTLRVTKAVTRVGRQSSFSVRAENVGPPGLGEWTVNIRYGRGLISVVDCEAPNGGVCNPSLDGNHMQVSGESTGGLVGDITLATFTFECDAEGRMALSPTLKTFLDTADQSIPALTVDGNVACFGVRGDATCDGTVGPSDALVILQAYAGLIGVVPCRALADVDGDGDADPTDAALILQREAGIIDGFPAALLSSFSLPW